MSTSPQVQRRTLSPRWQFSLLTLLIAMTWVGLVCVALCSPSELWTGLIFVLAVGSLLIASLTIIYRDGRARAFAVGFVIFGTTYFFVSMGDTPDVADSHTQLPTTRWGIALYSLLHGDKVQTSTGVGPIYSAPFVYSAPRPVTTLSPPPAGMIIESVVATTAATSGSASVPGAVAPAGGAPVPAPTFVPVTTYMTRTTTQTLVPLASFLEVVHHVLVILLGVIGGIVAQILYSTRREEQTTQQRAA